MNDDGQDATDAEARAILARNMIPHLLVRYEDLAWLYRDKAHAAIGALIATASAIAALVQAGTPALGVWAWVAVSVLWLVVAVHSTYTSRKYRKLKRFFVDTANDEGATP